MLVVIRGAGDIASGVALRLRRAGLDVVMLDLPQPTAIRRTVCFSEAIRFGTAQVEDITGRRAEKADEVWPILRRGEIAVLADPAGTCLPVLRPDAVVDAILAKRNLGTAITDAPAVIALGPGFTAGVDCHAVVETMRGHALGRVILSGAAQPNTGVPGLLGGYAAERVLRAPRDGILHARRDIGDLVAAEEIVAEVDGEPVRARIAGLLRGLLPDGTPVFAGEKAGDVDPRGASVDWRMVSDKALAVGGGVLEAVLRLTGALARQDGGPGGKGG